MSENSDLVALNTCRSWPSRCVAGASIATTLIVLAASGATQADSQRHSVVLRIDAKSAGLPPTDFAIRIGNTSVQAAAIQASPEIHRNVVIVVDAGPDQTKVLSKEKELAIALINELSNASTSFIVARAGRSSKIESTNLDQTDAVERIQEIAEDNGDKTNVAIYDVIGSAIRQLSLSPGLRVVIFIGEGNDGGSSLRYPQVRSLAESNQIAFFTVLIADHSLRGTKSILRYGWNLQELTSDTAGTFLENPKTANATGRIRESIQNLRLVAFEVLSLQSGRYKITVVARRGTRLHAQKAIVIP